MGFIIATGASAFFEKFGIEWDMLISQALMFTLLAVILYRFVFKPVSKAADERRAQIERGILDAQQAAKKLEECERSCSEKISNSALEASKIVAKTRDDAKAMIEAAALEASKKAAEISQKAQIEIAADRAKMKDELKGEIASLVVKTAEAVFAGALTEEVKAKIAKDAALKIENK